jgi:hypothetical protein
MNGRFWMRLDSNFLVASFRGRTND